MKTQEEILLLLQQSKNDFFGFAAEVLVGSLAFEHAKPFLKEGTPPEEWSPALTDETVRKAALAYLAFAWGKAEDHRGLSASRSVKKMTAYCWLLGYDVTRIDAAGYAMYGCPKLKVVAQLLEQPLPTNPALVNMMEGHPCEPHCEQGCRS